MSSVRSEMGRYAVVPVWLTQLKGLSGTAKLVYLSLAGYADAVGDCFPALRAIQGDLGVSESTVKRAMRELESWGVLEVRERRRPDGSQTSNLYRIRQTPPSGMTPGGSVEEPPPGSRVDPQEQTQENRPIEQVKPLLTEVSEFDQFWHAYPRKIGKNQARKAWERAVRDQVDPSVIYAAVLRMSPEWAGKDPKYTPHPATWLNRGGWDDQPTAKKESTNDRILRLTGAGQ